jgi:predicted nicotinamide N-methyase
MATEEFVRGTTRAQVVPFVPEVTLRVAGDPFWLWEETGREPPPFWAFPWAGGQGLARYVLDHPGAVAGLRVLDIASGSGLVAIAAALAGARAVYATDIDPCALAVIAVNAEANHVRLEPRVLDLETANGAGAFDVVLAADVCYERTLARSALGFLRRASQAGAEVLLADPGRAFLPREELSEVESYDIPVIRALEDMGEKQVSVYRLL